ncbi:hypothetical protein ESCO47_00136 [Escherichia phage vB_EcoM_ESCO47]|nr:hypothetical protein ESCO47_00136 [Escherichia phage vB_EcoM_ESCO47]
MNKIVKWFKSWNDGIEHKDWLDVLDENLSKEIQEHEKKQVEAEGIRLVKLYMGEPRRTL